MGVTIDGVDKLGCIAVDGIWIEMFACSMIGDEMDCGAEAEVAGDTLVCKGELGMLNSKLVRLPTLPIVGLGLRLPLLPIGLVRPLLVLRATVAVGAGATTPIRSSSSEVGGSTRIAAALSRTEGTLWSICSVVFERGVRWGIGG